MSVILVSQPAQAFVGLSNPYTSVMHFVFVVLPPEDPDVKQEESSTPKKNIQLPVLQDEKPPLMKLQTQEIVAEQNEAGSQPPRCYFEGLDILQRGIVRPDRERSKDFTMEIEGVSSNGAKGPTPNPNGWWGDRVHVISLRPSRRFCIDAKSDYSNDFYVKFRFLFMSGDAPHTPLFRGTVTSRDVNLRSKNKTATSEQYQAFRSGQILFRDHLMEGVRRARAHFQSYGETRPAVMTALANMPALPDNTDILEKYMGYATRSSSSNANNGATAAQNKHASTTNSASSSSIKTTTNTTTTTTTITAKPSAKSSSNTFSTGTKVTSSGSVNEVEQKLCAHRKIFGAKGSGTKTNSAKSDSTKTSTASDTGSMVSVNEGGSSSNVPKRLSSGYMTSSMISGDPNPSPTSAGSITSAMSPNSVASSSPNGKGSLYKVGTATFASVAAGPQDTSRNSSLSLSSTSLLGTSSSFHEQLQKLQQQIQQQYQPQHQQQFQLQLPRHLAEMTKAEHSAASFLTSSAVSANQKRSRAVRTSMEEGLLDDADEPKRVRPTLDSSSTNAQGHLNSQLPGLSPAQSQVSQQHYQLLQQQKQLPLQPQYRQHHHQQQQQQLQAFAMLSSLAETSTSLKSLQPESESASSRIASLESEVCELQTVVQTLTDRLDKLEKIIAQKG